LVLSGLTVASMRAVIQRVREASVAIGGREHARIAHGLLVLVAAEVDDTTEDVVWLSGKIARLRIFSDEVGKMNRALGDIAGEVLVVSQFTLFASTAQGNRPSFLRAARPQQAVPLYEAFVARLSGDLGRVVKTGVFAADMQVALTNDGPVTIVIDSRRRE
jgi:D-tyrosyl-tRNA(Tyr) deacylase